MSERWKEQAFSTLEPPSGGLAELRSRLDHKTRAKPTWAWLAPAVAIAFAIAILVAVPRPGERNAAGPAAARIFIDPGQTPHPALIHYGLHEASPEPVTVAPARRGDLAATRVALDHPDVVFYWVASPASQLAPER